MSIKTKLLEAVGEVDISDIGTEALVDILTSRIKAQDKKIQELHGENGAERERLYREIEQNREERKRMRRDPLYCARGDYFFKGNSGLLHLFIQGDLMKLCESKGKCDYILEQLSPEQYYGAKK